MPPTREQKSPALHYIALAAVALVTLTIYTLNARSFLGFLHHAHEWSRAPFRMDLSGQVIDSVEPEARAMHLQRGDRVVTLDGKEYRRLQQLWDEVEKTPPGAALVAGIEKADGKIVQISIPLIARQASAPSAALETALIFLKLIFPILSLLLGFWVVIAKPYDKNAWFLLGIFAFFNALFSQSFEHTHVVWLRFLALFGNSILSGAAFACIMLFGLYFPQRSRLDERFPWLKWCILAPMAALQVFDLFHIYALYSDFHRLRPLLRWGRSFSHLEQALGAACILVFFAGIISNARTAATQDARRRLRVLSAGSAIGLSGLLLLFVLSIYTGGQIEALLPVWLVMILVVIPLLFPITLAYVVVVQRAMDVRILLRLGTQYALARSTLWFLQFVLIAAITYRIARLVHEPEISQKDIFAVLSLGLLFLAVRYQVARSLSIWLDKKFFREAYSAEHVLSELASQVRSFTETQPLLETVIDQISKTLHIDQIAVLLNNGGSFRLQQAVGVSPTEPIALPENSSAIRYLLQSKSPATLYGGDPGGWLMLADASEREALQQLSAELLLPLPGRKEMMGIMALGPKRSQEPYSRADLQLLQSVAAQTGLAIENAELMTRLARESAQRERLNREIEIAREVQERLFPQTLPQIPGVDCAGHCRPAQGVGGDYYDFIELDSRRIGIALGDVSGKGISAALLMASLRASLRGITLAGSPHGSLHLSTLIQYINQLLHDSSTPSRYATFFFGEYDPHTRLLRYVNAGHNPPVVVRPRPNAAPGAPAAEGCDILRLTVGGPVVGLLDNPQYETGTLMMRDGDVLAAFTDGISEAMNAQDEEWGEERMIAALYECYTQPANKILEHIFHCADAFTQNAPQHDDMTLVVLRLVAPDRT